MKKPLLVLAALGAAAGSANAQSNVTIFGVMDVNARVVSNIGFVNRKSLAQDGLNTSRLGFRGVEDLGGGLTAAFWLEGGVSPITGGPTFNFTRESHVTFGGPFGKIRLGRDYTPNFYQTTAPFEPFGNNGVGSSVNLARFNGGSNHVGGAALQQPSSLRASNSMSYFLPNLGGLYGQVMLAPSQGTPNGKYTGARLGYASGPLIVATGVARQQVDSGAGKYQVLNLAATYDFGFARLMGQYNREKLTTVGARETRWLLGAVIPVGGGDLRASYVHSDLADSPNDASQVAVGYVYPLSKRTALYSTASRLTNHGAAQFSVSGGSAPGSSGNPSPGGPTPGGRSTGFEVGLRHFF